MSFGRLKTRLKALINRKDLTDQLAGDFILDAIAAHERNLRLEPMTALLEKTDWDGTRNVYPVPANYLTTIAFVTDEGALEYKGLDEFIRAKPNTGYPVIYTKVGNRFLLKPTPAIGKSVFLHYYAETLRPTLDTDRTLWTEVGFLATLYKAAELAADFFQMEPDIVGGYANKAQEHADSIAGQALDEAWSGRIAVSLPSNTGDF